MMGRRFATRVKRVLMKTAETKRYTFGAENIQLYHNGGVTGGTASIQAFLFNPWSFIAQGTTRNTRVGDQISATGMSLRIWLANKLDRPNVLYRIVVGVVPKTSAGVATDKNFDPFFLAFNNGACGNVIVAPIDPEKIRVLYDKVLSLERGQAGTATGTNKECHRYLKLWIRKKRSKVIQYDSANTIVNNPLVVWILPYDSYGTLSTDNIASCAVCTTLYFKDV